MSAARAPWEATPFRFADMPAPAGFTDRQVGVDRAEHEVLWIAPTRQVHGGAQTVALLLRTGSPPVAFAAATLLPPLGPPTSAVYRLVALNRHRLPGGTARCALPRR